MASDGSPDPALSADAAGNLTATADLAANGDILANAFLRFVKGGTLTIASGVITVTASFHIIDTEGGAASDDLRTINGGTTGCILFLRTLNATKVVTLIDHVSGADNLLLQGDFAMTSAGYWIMLMRPNSTQWSEIARSTP